MQKIVFVLFLCFPSLLYGQNSKSLIRGSFIQPNLFATWDDARWHAEFDYLRQAGLDFIIFMHTVHTGKDGLNHAVYPTSISTVKPHEKDLLEDCLRNAEQANFKVFVGLNFDERWWALKADSVIWLMESLELGNKVAAEIVERYKIRYANTLHGWYWVWEIEPSMCKEQQNKELLVQGLNTSLDYLQRLTPDMPVLLSPFMNYKMGDLENCAEVWQYVLKNAHFKDGDIFAPQDCIGSGFLNMDIVVAWFEKLARIIPQRPRIQFWGNVEMFDQRFWTVAPVGRLIRQMDLLRPFVSGFISFAYSHYYSPALNNPLIHNSYVEYVQKGCLPVCQPPLSVSSLRVSTNDSGGEVILEWKPAEEEKGVMGYHIYKDELLIGDVQYDHNNTCRYNWDIQRKPGTYSVASYNICGDESERIVLSLVE